MFVIPIIAYAEIHYRFKYFISFIKRAEPEIIADAPHRIEPDAHLPILIIIKDSHQYPIQLVEVKISFFQEGKEVCKKIFPFENSHTVNSKLWWKIISISFDESLKDLYGHFSVNVEISYRINGVCRNIHNNNLPTSSKSELKIYRSKTSLPAFQGWIQGDTHTHSNYTDDQVEFGSPIVPSVELSKSMGLSYYCIADHSYDLDDRLDSYLLNDPTLPKWKLFQDEVDAVNTNENNFAVLRGEEVSCSNSLNQNVHFLLWGNRNYFYGKGDGGEKWFRLQSEHTIKEILKEKDSITVAYASHPTEEVPFLQQLLLGRNEWTVEDMNLDGLHGLQILNGERNSAFEKGLKIWQFLLIKGKKIFIAAGNDAHGNFNRFIQISIPMLLIREKETQIFGKMRTVVKTNSVREDSILTALRTGASVITNGPVVIFDLENENNHSVSIGEEIRAKKIVVKVRGISSEEFGIFSEIKIIIGIIGQKEIVHQIISSLDQEFSFHKISDWVRIESFSYIRVEAVTKNAKGFDSEGFCYTNPIWILPA